jgi:hypothetical protein
MYLSARMRLVRLALAAMVATAGQKLYDMSVFFQKDRGASVARGMRRPVPKSAAGDERPVAPLVWTGAPLQLPAADDPRAREQSKFDFADLFSEFIIGTWRHDPRQDNNESDTIDLNAEIIFRKLRPFDVENPIADFILSPRPLIGGSANNKNETHTAYAALNWRHIFANDVFISGSFGFAYHTGNLHRPTRQCPPSEGCNLPGNRAFDDDRRAVTLGLRVLFRESIAIGYRIKRRHLVSFYAAHISNGGLDDDNDGMNFVGIRYGYGLE